YKLQALFFSIVIASYKLYIASFRRNFRIIINAYFPILKKQYLFSILYLERITMDHLDKPNLHHLPERNDLHPLNASYCLISTFHCYGKTLYFKKAKINK